MPKTSSVVPAGSGGRPTSSPAGAGRQVIADLAAVTESVLDRTLGSLGGGTARG